LDETSDSTNAGTASSVPAFLRNPRDLFYKTDTPDNLKTIYRQLAEVLFDNQYILDYVSALGTGVTADLKIEASLS